MSAVLPRSRQQVGDACRTAVFVCQQDHVEIILTALGAFWYLVYILWFCMYLIQELRFLQRSAPCSELPDRHAAAAQSMTCVHDMHRCRLQQLACMKAALVHNTALMNVCYACTIASGSTLSPAVYSGIWAGTLHPSFVK